MSTVKGSHERMEIAERREVSKLPTKRGPVVSMPTYEISSAAPFLDFGLYKGVVQISRPGSSGCQTVERNYPAKP